jgi:AraC-like DNA-binding protein
MRCTVFRYREYAPCAALRGYVRAIFSFSEPDEELPARQALLDVQFERGERICAPAFADAHSCIVFSSDKVYYPDGAWRRSSAVPRGDLIGPLTHAGAPSVPARAECIGAFLTPGTLLPGISAAELEDRAIAIENMWGAEGRRLAEMFSWARSETERLEQLESALGGRLMAREQRRTSLDIPGIARWMARRCGRLPVERVAQAAGVSRRHLTRVFEEDVGVSPKTYSELARFRSALACVRRGKAIGWANVAAQCGYADQSHMIAEFRRFTGFTPDALLRGRWFHPFIEQPAPRSFSGIGA